MSSLCVCAMLCAISAISLAVVVVFFLSTSISSSFFSHSSFWLCDSHKTVFLCYGLTIAIHFGWGNTIFVSIFGALVLDHNAKAIPYAEEERALKKGAKQGREREREFVHLNSISVHGLHTSYYHITLQCIAMVIDVESQNPFIIESQKHSPKNEYIYILQQKPAKPQ